MFEKKFLMPLFCLVVVLGLSATATRGANILFVSSMTAVEDDALKAFMEGLGHTVTYIDDDEDEATTEAAAAAADLVFISESVGSGGIKNEITEIEVPMIVGEPWAWDEMGLTEGSGGDDPAVTTDVEIVDPGHYLASGLSGTVAVLNDILMGCNLGKGVTGPEATVIATATLSDGVTYDVIFVYEKGAALPVAPADGSAQVAADIRIGFGFHADCGPVLNDNVYALLGAAVDYALGLTGPVAEVDGRLIVPKTSVAPIIDAELDDVWQNVGEEGVLITEIINATSAVPEDLSDLSATFQVMYDDDNFYIYVVIQDSVIDYEFSDWNGDGVEFFFDGDNSKGSSYDGVNDNQIRITVDDVELANIDSSLPVDGSAFKVILTDLGYNIEASFPLETLQIVPENTFGFEVQINDNDGGGGRETMIRWFSNDNNSWRDASLFGEAVLTAEPELPGLIGHWKLDDGEGVVAVDSSGSGNDGTIYNADAGGLGDGGSVWFNDPERGMVISFNGEDSGAYVSTPGKIIPAMSLDKDFTWAFWAKQHADQATNNDVILGNRYGGTESPLQFIKFTPTRFEFFNEDYDYLEAVNYEPVPGDEWVHHVIVKDGTSLTYYRNGKEAGTSTITKTIDENPLYMGGDVTAEHWQGYMSDVRIYDRALSENEVIGLAGKTPVDPGTDGLVAFYALENDVLDSSGNGNDGTIVGAPTFVDGPAGYGMAMEFHGLGAPGGGGDYIDCGNDASLDITGPISIALWIRPGADDPEGQGTTTAPMAKAMDGVGWSWQVRYGWGSPQPYMAFTFNSSPRAWAYVGRNLERDEWCHIACSHDGTTLKCYLDGEQTDSTPMGQITSSEAPVLIGSDGWGCDWIGAIDEVAIYNRDLSAGEVRYLAGFRPGPVAHYKLDEGEGTIAVDSSGNGNDGTLEDGPTVVDGQFGQALAFEDSRVAIPASDSLTADMFQGSFTLSAWINPKRTGDTWQQIFRSMIADDTSNDTLFLNNDGRLSWRGRIGGAWAGGMCETASDVVPADQWTHFAVVGDGTNFRIYVNGALSQESAFQTTDGTNATYYIGGDPTWIGESYSGLIDEVRIYDRALSSDEVSELAVKAVDPSLVIYYSFDDVGEIVADQSGKGHDGVVVGDVTAEPEGMYNGAANFASGSYLDLDGASFPAEDIPTSAMTLAAWIKCANTGGDHEIFSARASDNSWLIHPEPKSSGDIRWLLRSYGGTTIFQIRAGTMTWDEWLHFAGTYDKESGKAALYINGELIEEIVVENPADIAGDWDLGARVGYTIDNARPFTGLMDEFRMYTRALSQDEILTIMQGM